MKPRTLPGLPSLVLLCSAALASGGCGSWSNTELEFKSALPTREELSSRVPASSGGRGLTRQALSIGSPSELYLSTRQASGDFNAVVDGLLDVIEQFRVAPATSGAADRRVWGPFVSSGHPGFELRMVMDRVDEATLAYELAFRQLGGATWRALLRGEALAGADVRRGAGRLALDWARARAVGFGDDALGDLGVLEAEYDATTALRQVDLRASFTKDGVDASGARYSFRFREQPERGGSLRFDVMGGPPEASSLRVESTWLTDGRGRATAEVLEGAYTGAEQEECWDADYLLVYGRQGWLGGVTIGDLAQCVERPILAQ